MRKRNGLVKICVGFFIINLILIAIVNLLGARIVTLTLKSDESSGIQLFYVTKDNQEFNAKNSNRILYQASTELIKIRSLIFTKNIDKFRIDFGEVPANFEAGYLSISDGLFLKKIWNKDYLIKDFNKIDQIEINETNSNNLKFKTLGNDGHISGNDISGETKINTKSIFLEILIIIFLYLFFYFSSICREIKKYLIRVSNFDFIKKLRNSVEIYNTGIAIEFSNIKKYLLKNKYIIYVLIFFTILAHGVSIFYYKIGIDSELTIMGHINEQKFISIGRFGVVLIKKIFSTNSITIPAYNNLLALVMLILFEILSMYIINKYSKKNNALASVGFFIIFITFSQIPTYATFILYSFEVSFGFFIVALSVLYLTRAILDKSNIVDFILGILLLMFTISIYQCFISLYVSLVCAILFVRIKSENNKKSVEYFTELGKFILALVIACIIYFSINLVLTHSLVNSEGYLGGFIGWKNKTSSAIMLTIINSIKAVIFSGYGFEMLRISYIILFIILARVALTKREKIYIIYLVGLMISPFLLNIGLGSVQPIRSLVALPFFVGIVVYILIIMIKNIKIQKIIFVGIFLCSMYQAQITSSLYFGDYVRYNQDVQLGNEIAERIEKLNLGEKSEYPVIYIGLHSSKNKTLIIRDEAIGYSFFEWGGGSIQRIKDFMDIIGHNYLEPSQEDIQKAYESSKNMSVWPNTDSVKFQNNMIIVKLSEPTERWENTNNVY